MTPFDNATQLDLRRLSPTLRHALLETTFQWLKVGQAMEVRFDGEPQALRQALESRHPRQIDWAVRGDRIVARRTAHAGAQPLLGQPARQARCSSA